MSLGTASLEIQIRTEDVRRAGQDLKRLAETGGSTDRAVSVLQNRMSMLERAAAKASQELRRQREVARSSGDSMSEFDNKTLKMVRSLRSAESALNSTGRAFRKFKGDVESTATGADRSSASVQRLHGILGSIRGLFASFGIGMVARSIVDLGNHFSRVSQMLLATTGSAQKAGTEFQYLMTLSKSLGIGFLGLADSYAQFSTASQGTALEGKKMKDVFEAIAQTATVMRFDVENTRGVIKAFEQMLSKGTVQAEELRNQLGDRLPGAFALFVRAQFGSKVASQEQRAEFNKMMKEGKIVADEILPKVAAELKRTFGAGLTAATKSAQAEISRMQTAWQELVLVMWNGGLEDAVKNVAMALRSLLESEGTIQVVKAFASGIAYLSQVLFDFRAILLPATLALTTFVAVFTAGKAISGLMAFVSVGKSATGIIAGIAAASVGLAAAFGAMNTKTDETVKKQKSAGNELKRTASIIDDLSAALAPEQKSTPKLAMAFDSRSPVEQLGDGFFNAARGALEYARAAGEVKKVQEDTNKTLQTQVNTLKSLNWAGALSAGLGAASLAAMARPKIAAGIASATERANTMGGIGGLAGAAIGAIPSSVKGAVSNAWSASSTQSFATVDKLSDSLGKAEARMMAYSTANAAAAPIMTRMASSLGGVAGAASRAAPALGVAATAMSGLGTAGRLALGLVGGLPGLLIGGLVASGFALVEWQKKKDEAFSISPENKEFFDFLAGLGDKGPVNPDANVDALIDKSKVYKEALKAQQDAEKQYLAAKTDYTTRLAALNSKLLTQDVDIDGVNRSLLAAEKFKDALAGSALGPEYMGKLSEAINKQDYNKIASIAQEVMKIEQANPGLERTAQAFVEQSSGVRKTQNEITSLNTLLVKAAENWNIFGKNASQAVADAQAAAGDAAKYITLNPKVEDFVKDAVKDSRTTLRYGSLSPTQRRIKQLEDAKAGIDPANPDAKGAKPITDPSQTKEIDDAIALARAADKVKPYSKGGASAGRSAESRANSKAADFARAQATIYSLLDPVRAERTAMDEEVRELTRSLTRGGMSAAEANTLLAKYRELRTEEVEAAARANKRQVEAQYGDTIGVGGKSNRLSEIESDLDSFRIAAMRAGEPIDEINIAIEQMRTAKIAEMERGFNDMGRAANEAASSLTDLQDKLNGILGLSSNGAASALNDFAKAQRDIRDRRLSAQDERLSALKTGADPATVESNYLKVIEDLNREERLNTQIKDARIAKMDREGETLTGLISKYNEYSSQAEEAERTRTMLSIPGFGGDKAAADAIRRTPYILKEYIPDADPNVIRDMPDLLEKYGKTANDTITPWYEKVKAINDALKAAQSGAQADYSLGRRDSAELSGDEVGQAATRGVNTAATDRVVERQRELASQVQDVWKQAGDNMAGLFADVFRFDEEMNSLKEFGRAFARMIQEMIVEIIRLAIIKAATKALMLAKGGVPTVPTGGTTVNAKGNTYADMGMAANDNLKPLRAFANGVVHNPTYFAMGGGQTGLMGEAGSEGIFPLARTRSGDLGVQVVGGGGRGGVNVVNNINITVEGSGEGNSVEDMAMGAKKARETIEGIAAETYFKLGEHESRKSVTV